MIDELNEILTGGDNDRFTDSDIFQRRPHISFHLGIYARRELIY